jgi:predicted nucleic acid-binding Zn ribbon protein
MITYKYRCVRCGMAVEYMLSKYKISESASFECIACGGSLEFQICETYFQLKGKGRAKDGYSKVCG